MLFHSLKVSATKNFFNESNGSTEKFQSMKNKKQFITDFVIYMKHVGQ